VSQVSRCFFPFPPKSFFRRRALFGEFSLRAQPIRGCDYLSLRWITYVSSSRGRLFQDVLSHFPFADSAAARSFSHLELLVHASKIFQLPLNTVFFLLSVRDTLSPPPLFPSGFEVPVFRGFPFPSAHSASRGTDPCQRLTMSNLPLLDGIPRLNPFFFGNAAGRFFPFYVDKTYLGNLRWEEALLKGGLHQSLPPGEFPLLSLPPPFLRHE